MLKARASFWHIKDIFPVLHYLHIPCELFKLWNSLKVVCLPPICSQGPPGRASWLFPGLHTSSLAVLTACFNR